MDGFWRSKTLGFIQTQNDTFFQSVQFQNGKMKKASLPSGIIDFPFFMTATHV